MALKRLSVKIFNPFLNLLTLCWGRRYLFFVQEALKSDRSQKFRHSFVSLGKEEEIQILACVKKIRFLGWCILFHFGGLTSPVVTYLIESSQSILVSNFYLIFSVLFCTVVALTI